ncbi:MAG: haloacid dehalogenase type II [Acidocella sp.]|nr:haloacid dehalogenase type II [Acidocella sp.]
MRARAILFDVFGTVVDWRGSVAAALAATGARHGLVADWSALADAWRGQYAPSMNAVRQGRRPWAILDDLHRDAIVNLLPQFGLQAMVAEADTLVKIWHHLTPWPDSVAGLRRLRQNTVVAPLSNGHVALQIALARYAGIEWDMVFGADIYRHYKPDSETYLGATALLGLAPGQVMLAAAHNEDLAAARALGLQTAFISRPMEFGSPDHRAVPSSDWDYVATSIEDLADQMQDKTATA